MDSDIINVDLGVIPNSPRPPRPGADPDEGLALRCHTCDGCGEIKRYSIALGLRAEPCPSCQ